MTRGHRTALSPSPRATSLCTLMPCTAHTCAHAYCGACRGRGRLLPGQGSALRTATRPCQDSAPGRPARPRTDPGSPERRPAGTTCAGTGLERPPPRGARSVYSQSPARGSTAPTVVRAGPRVWERRRPRAPRRRGRGVARGAAPVLLCWGRGAARRISRAPPRLTEANSSRRQWRVPAHRGLRARTPGRMGARGPLADVFFFVCRGAPFGPFSRVRPTPSPPRRPLGRLP
ncbi:R-LORF1 [Gallid alphaherpesvirus 2]|uniref:R-LORF1 n=1 Tax=Gallid alphaherpesvirus 2 TaxID=10390 RepID=I6SFQ8_9ALPH|nr:R-LORF1 [Gallid alphaherpesvirus 2]AFM75593.1 R-LORF1 [Gallid alphaherpesvirus 2]